jgi:secondary thiamine-phosphate synthase enzyme
MKPKRGAAVVFHETLAIELEPEFATADLSGAVVDVVARSGVQEGIATLFCRGSTAAVTTIEYESGCLCDLRRALETLAPAHGEYAHNARWGDGNGFSHLRAALLGPSLTVPITDGRPVFSTWQQPILINFDNRGRHREIRVTVVGLS